MAWLSHSTPKMVRHYYHARDSAARVHLGRVPFGEAAGSPAA